MKFLLLIPCILTLSNAHNHPPVPMAMANLTVNGATGYVKVWGGRIQVSLDLNNFNWGNVALSKFTCNATNLNWHIHFARGLSTAGVDATCGPTNTGGHYDPWYACGGATDQTRFCANKNPGGCINKPYACSPTAFQTSPFACEVGDWSGKYGSLKPRSFSNFSFWLDTASLAGTPSRFEISASELYNVMRPKSVVFHCGSPRLICAPFNMSMMTGADAYFGETLASATAGGRRMVADLGSIGGPLVEFGGGEVQVGGNGVTTGMNSIWATCASVSAPFISMAVMQGTLIPATGIDSACAFAAAAGGVYDPTVACVPGSAAGQPTAGDLCQSVGLVLANNFQSTRCPGKNTSQSFNYTTTTQPLNPLADPYLRAQGALNPYNPLKFNTTVEYRLMDQSSAALLNKLFFVTCGTKIWCTKIVAGPVTYVPQTPPVTPTTTTTTTANPMTTAVTTPQTTSSSDRALVSVVVVLMAVVGGMFTV